MSNSPLFHDLSPEKRATAIQFLEDSMKPTNGKILHLPTKSKVSCHHRVLKLDETKHMATLC